MKYKFRNFWKKESLDKCIDNYNDQIRNLESDIILKALINDDIGIYSYYKTIKKIKLMRRQLLSKYNDYATKN